MARITIDDCLEKVDNRFVLVVAAAKRARQLQKRQDGTEGAKPTIECENREIITALREIAAGNIGVK